MTIQPRYPVCILSKGRADSRLTSKTLEECGIDYRIFVEQSEYSDYAAVIDPRKVHALPADFRTNPRWAIPDVLGQCGGGIPVRNYIWDLMKQEGHKRFWLLDDNIRHFYRSHKNTKLRCVSSTPLRVVEDMADRYENVGLAGLNYANFMPTRKYRPAYQLNSRIYSCILASTDLPFMFRGKYNEDTDLSLRVLKEGLCTLLINAFTCGKMATHSMKGGNTNTVYAVGGDEFDNRRQFAETLKAMHPDCVEITQKWGRWHHQVDYSKWERENTLKLKSGIKLQRNKDEYGLKLVRLDPITFKPAAVVGDAITAPNFKDQLTEDFHGS